MNSRQEKIESIQHLMMLIESEAEKVNKNQKSFYEQLKNNHELLIKLYSDPYANSDYANRDISLKHVLIYTKVDHYINEQKNFAVYIKKIYNIIEHIYSEMELE